MMSKIYGVVIAAQILLDPSLSIAQPNLKIRTEAMPPLFELVANALVDADVKPDDFAGMPQPIANKKYVMTFSDDFTSLDTISKGNNFDGAKWYNGVEQCCMSDVGKSAGAMFPTSINGKSVYPYSIIPEGGLNITLSKVGDTWFSGILTSVDRLGKGFSQKYGYFEIRAKMPKGLGTWPAFWMKSESNLLTHDDLGEIDIFEHYGVGATGFCTTYHDWTNQKALYYNCRNPTPDLTEDFHNWGLLWTDKKMTVYFDDKIINETDTPLIMQQAYYLILDLGIGGGWPTTQTPFSNTMQIQYIRAYAPVSSAE